jgi:hypothetical protein
MLVREAAFRDSNHVLLLRMDSPEPDLSVVQCDLVWITMSIRISKDSWNIPALIVFPFSSGSAILTAKKGEEVKKLKLSPHIR